MENQEPEVRILTKRITRRQAVKAGGIAAVGLAFSKPMIGSVFPKPAFAQSATPLPCGGTISNTIDNMHFNGDTVMVHKMMEDHLMSFCEANLVCAGSCTKVGETCVMTNEITNMLFVGGNNEYY